MVDVSKLIQISYFIEINLNDFFTSKIKVNIMFSTIEDLLGCLL